VLSVSAHAEIGSVTETSGTTIIKRGKEIIQVAKGTLVEMNDRVETKNGKTKITFKDNTIVTVTESSALLIDDFVYDAKSGAGKLGLKAAAGTVRYVSGKIAHNNPNSVKINTPTAAITVRGTDFVMSVAETGSSMIILMPTCETEQNVNLKGLSCGSGKIDVDSGGTRITLDRPYQATMVETQGQPPSPPLVVNLDGRAIGNNLMLSPPTTGSGANIVAAAKAATAQTGDSMASAAAESQQVSQNASDQAKAQRENTAKAAATTLEISSKLVESGIKIGDVSNNEYIYKTYKDISQTQQVGWGYERLSSSGFNYVNIALTMDTKALVVVTQDLITDAYNSNTMSSRSYGTIVINQSYR
jgi:hypothetical protein